MDERREIKNLLARLSADNDQDIEAAKRWWRKASNANKMRVFGCIGRKYNNPVAEVASRFAQIGFTEIALRCDTEDVSKML